MSSQSTSEKEAENREQRIREMRRRSDDRYRLDNLERQIIRLLNGDARMPFQAIARELGVDEKTVRNRVSKLREKGVLSFRPAANANVVRGCFVAVVTICINNEIRNDVEHLAEELAALPMVSWVGTVMGQYDLIAEVIVESWDDLTAFELYELAKIRGIGATSSFLVLSHYGERGVPFVDAITDPR